MNAIMAILDGIEHLCKLDVELQLGEEKFKDEIEASENFVFLENLRTAQNEDIQEKANEIFEKFIEIVDDVEMEVEPEHERTYAFRSTPIQKELQNG